MPKILVEVVDRVNQYYKLYGSKQGVVETEGDWRVIELCYELFRISYPDDLKVFVETQKRIRYNLKHEHGGVDGMRHMLNIPQKMYQTISVFYPQQKWDKEFGRKLCTRLPVLKVPKHF